MYLESSSRDHDRLYNNPDSFAMSFDSAWKILDKENDETFKSKEDKKIAILSKIKDHPFLKESPQKAEEIADFRIRLLKLK